MAIKDALMGIAQGAATGSMGGVPGAIIGTAVGLGSAIYGGIKSSQQANAARKLIEQQRDDNRKWYQARSAEDYTMRSDAQAALTKQRELLAEQYSNARATNIVAGGSDESLTEQKMAANRSLAQTTSDIAADASKWKDSIENAYRSQDAALNQQQAADLMTQSGNTAAAASQAVNAGLDFAGNSINSAAIKKVIAEGSLKA